MLRNPAPRRSLAAFAALDLACALSGCVGAPAEAPTTTVDSGSGTPTSTTAVSETGAPTAATTNTPVPSRAASAPASPSATEPAPTPSTTTSPLTIFYVAVNDKGKSGPMIGCDDSIVATETGSVIYASQVEAAMSTLLTDQDAQHGQSGLVNTLSDSNLEFVSSSLDGDTVTVELTGDLTSGGVCDDPRVMAQLTYTAMVAAGTGEAKVLVNGTEVHEYLSQK